jgi:signal transduction histidine kinase
MKQINNLLNLAPVSLILWAWPLARLLLSCIFYLMLSSNYQDSTAINLEQSHFFVWLGWTVATTLLAFSGQPLQSNLLRIIIIGDTVLTLAAVILVRGVDGAVIIFAISVSAVAFNVRLPSKWIYGGIAVGIVAFALRDVILLQLDAPLPRVTILSDVSQALQGMLLFILLLISVVWANRRHRLDKFTDAYWSLRTLSRENSFDFDLQTWTNACSSLFWPQKAACVMQTPAKHTTTEYYHCNVPIWQRDQDRSELVAALRELPAACLLFDTEHNRIVVQETGQHRPFNADEQCIARILHRADIKAALVQPLQIDRARGGFICAINSPIDAIVIAEALLISRHNSEMTEYLGKVARLQRNFIADAHDVARRDLHDGVLQTLAALRMRLLMLTKREDVAQKAVEFEIRKAVDIVTLEQSRLRGFLENSESADHTVNLVSQMDICVRTISLQWGVDVKLKSEEPAIPVDTESSFNIEHLLREVIANAVRHAKSKSLTVTLSLKQDALMMAVSDLNQPPEGAQVYEKSALTMKSASLRDRLRLVNGEAYAEGLGKGTLLSIRIPMQQVEND